MARKFLTAIDLTQLELQNARVQNLASAPSAPVKGQIYMNTTDNTLYWYDGAAWVAAKAGSSIAFGAVPAETTFGIAKADGVAATAARSDHTHGSPAHSAAEHSTIPLSALAAAAANISMGGFVINNVGTPVVATDAANKGYVDNAIAGLSWKDSVRLASIAQVALTGLVAIDGSGVLAGDRILLKNQTAPAENGIWIAASGAWTRATDADAGTELLGAAVYVEEGTTNADTAWVMTTNGPITVGTTTLTWSQFAGGGAVTAGAGMTQSGNVLNVIGDSTLTVVADQMGIADNGVSNPKLADMPAMTVKGNNTGATTDPQDVTMTALAATLGGLLMRRYAVNVGGATSVVVTHNFNSSDVIVEVYRVGTPFDSIECDVEHTSVNTITVRFAVAPAAAEYRCVVMG